MKVYLQGLLFSLVVALAYFFIDLQFFNLNILKITREKVFNTFKTDYGFDQTIILYNTGTLSDSAVIANVNLLLAYNPRVIGINACDLENYDLFVAAFGKNPKVVIANCPGEPGPQLSSVLMEGNTITHFQTNTTMFEAKIANNQKALLARGSETEMINFNPGGFFKFELKDAGTIEGDHENVFIVGYLGDHLSPEEQYYFEGARITPLNPFYGSEENVSPDMFDTEIAAHIVSTIWQESFIDEVPLWARALIIFAVCVINVGVIMLIKTRWIIANVAIYSFTFFLLILISSFMVVYLFTTNIYLNLDGLEILLLITSVFTAFTVRSETKISSENTITPEQV
jgi:hypothetical protein